MDRHDDWPRGRHLARALGGLTAGFLCIVGAVLMAGAAAVLVLRAIGEI